MADHQERFLSLLLAEQVEIKAFISAVVRDRNLADDLFQEVALILWRRFDQFDESRSFGSWGRGIARNLILRHWDKLRRQPVLLTEEAMEAVSAAYDETESDPSALRAALHACVGQLPEKSRRLVSLRYETALSLKDLAARLGTTLDAVNKALGRIRTALQECIEERLKTRGAV